MRVATHSMGAYVLRHALPTTAADCGGGVPRISDQVLLVAAEEDEDTFEHDHNLGRLPELARGVNGLFQQTRLRARDLGRGKARLAASRGDAGPRLPAQMPSRVVQILGWYSQARAL